MSKWIVVAWQWLCGYTDFAVRAWKWVAATILLYAVANLQTLVSTAGSLVMLPAVTLPAATPFTPGQVALVFLASMLLLAGAYETHRKQLTAAAATAAEDKARIVDLAARVANPATRYSAGLLFYWLYELASRLEGDTDAQEWATIAEDARHRVLTLAQGTALRQSDSEPFSAAEVADIPPLRLRMLGMMSRLEYMGIHDEDSVRLITEFADRPLVRRLSLRKRQSGDGPQPPLSEQSGSSLTP